MPTDLLLPAFALTLLANAALVAMAVRGLLRARAERDRQDATNRQRNADRAPAVIERPATAPVAGATPPPSIEPDAVTEPPVEPDTAPSVVPATPKRRTRAAATTPPLRDARPKPTEPARRKRVATGERPPTEARRGGRRRFSLPPLDEDHERVNRSIETFLSGSDSTDSGEAPAAPSTVATTVAIVAIDGLHPEPSVADRLAVDGVLGTVERGLRGAARASDRISADGTGRFRVVLPATGELAARAYLRRVRATVGPSLESVDVPLGLVTATATVLDDTVHVAVAQAEARLDAAMASVARRRPDEGPRVAPD